MNRAAKVIIALVVIAAFAAGGFYFWQQSHPPILPEPPAAKPAPPAAPAGPKFPVSATPEPALPPLGASDPAARDVLASLFGVPAIDRFFNVQDVVRRIVATVDNLPREAYAVRLNPVKPTPGLPKTAGSGDTLAWSPDNSKRYAPFVKLVDGIDTAKGVALYLRYYPLFQQAYRELGYPQGHFNDRLVEVIDHLLETPEVRGQIRVVTPHVLYEFADPTLQSRSAGQKLLIRMGADNAAKVKAKLREVRAQVTAGAPPKS